MCIRPHPAFLKIRREKGLFAETQNTPFGCTRQDDVYYYIKNIYSPKHKIPHFSTPARYMSKYMSAYRPLDSTTYQKPLLCFLMSYDIPRDSFKCSYGSKKDVISITDLFIYFLKIVA